MPPQVTYELTDRGKELFEVLDRLYDLAERWYGSEEESIAQSTSI
ncbi:winged helix-turn-helix transcriptional regulator [Leptolyngbya sp. FACHB-36]